MTRPVGYVARVVRELRRGTWVREFIGFGSSTVLDQGARLIASLVVAGLLGPATWGVWYLLNLVLQYGGMVHLGALNGMNREVPAAIGRGDPARADRIGAAALGFTLVSYAVATSVLMVLLVPLGVIDASSSVWLTAGLLAGQQLFSFAFMNLKARMDFGGASRLQFLSAFVFPLLSIAGAYLAGLDGFLAGQIVWYLVLCAAAYARKRDLFRPTLERALSVRLIKIGFPIMLVGVAHAIFATVDRWIILGRLDAEALGQYSIAIMALGAVTLLPRVIAQQVYPRMAVAWSRDPRWSSLSPLIARQAWMALSVIVPVSLGLALIAPWTIRTLLPAYEPGIPAVLVSLSIPLIRVLGLGFGNAFNVVGLQHLYLLGIVIGATVNAGVSLVLVSTLGLVGVAWGTAAGYLALSTFLVVAGTVLRRTPATAA